MSDIGTETSERDAQRDGFQAFLMSLEARDVLSHDERSALLALDWRRLSVAASREIVGHHRHTRQSCLLLSGLAARAMWLRNGERQISAVHVPGDFVDLHGLFLKVLDHSVIALTNCQIATVDHDALRALFEGYPHLGRVLTTLVAIDAAIQRNWIVGLGRQPAEARLARLVCELAVRMDIVGLLDDGRFPFPVTQETLSDILGLSLVHTNRKLMQLRDAGYLTWTRGEVTICDWEGLCELAEFDGIYLNRRQEPR